MKKKITALCLVVALLAIMLVGGSLAYFTDQTEAAVNTFTVGNVDIDLTEPEWTATATHTLMPGTVFEKNPTITVAKGSQDAWVFLKLDLNKYVSLINLMGVDYYMENELGEYPGFTAFVQNMVKDTALRADVLGKWFTGIEHEKWTVMNQDEIAALVENVAKGQNANKLEVILGYNTAMEAGESVTFMTAFGMPKSITQSMMDGEDAYYIEGVSKSDFNTDKAEFKMTFTAYAIQKAELDTLADAYGAMFGTT